MSLVQTEISALQVPIPNSFLEMQVELGEKWQVERFFFVGYLARHVLREESEHSQTLYLNLQSQANKLYKTDFTFTAEPVG